VTTFGRSHSGANVKATTLLIHAVKEVKSTSDGAYTIRISIPEPTTLKSPPTDSRHSSGQSGAAGCAEDESADSTDRRPGNTEITVTGVQETIDTADASRGWSSIP
jgi:hypothetical protein